MASSQSKPGALSQRLTEPAEAPKTPRKAASKGKASAAPETTVNPFRNGMRRSRAPEPATLVIFGATGDLSRRKLLPAVFGLWQDGLLGSAFNIVGVGRQEMTDEQFRDYALEALKTSKETDAIQPGSLEKFRDLLYYEYGDFATDEVYDRVGKQLDEAENAHGGRKNAVFYLSTPPSLFEPISNGLGRLGLQDESEGWRRIIIEKPFGTTLESARRLNDVIHAVWNESQVYRIDHYLGKETVQNLMAIRFGNAIFEPLWNRSYVDHIQITAAEDLGLEGRAGYYEEAGIIRDMLQNHLMQLFTLVAMEPPVAFDEGAIRDEKVKVLRAVKPIPASQVRYSAVRGQYGPHAGGRARARLPRGAERRAAVQHAHLRGDQAGGRQLALAGRAVLHPDRQAPPQEGHGDRRGLQAPPARPVPGRPGAQRARVPHPAGRGRQPEVQQQDARAGEPAARGDDGLPLRRVRRRTGKPVLAPGAGRHAG